MKKNYITGSETVNEIEQLEKEIKQKKDRLRALRSQRKCEICGETFHGHTNGKYCDNPCPKDITMTCKEYASRRLWYKNMSEIDKKEKRVRSVLAMRCRRHPNDAALAEKYANFLFTNKNLRKLLSDGEYSLDQYERWLEEQTC